MKKQLVEFLLPLAAEGTKVRTLSLGRDDQYVKPVTMKASTTCASLYPLPGDVLRLHDDDKEIVSFVIPAGMPGRFDLSVKVGAPCHVPPTVAPVTPPSGEQRVQDPVAIVQAVQVQVVRAQPESSPKPVSEMTTQEKLAAGLKPKNVAGKIVWE